MFHSGHWPKVSKPKSNVQRKESSSFVIDQSTDEDEKPPKAKLYKKTQHLKSLSSSSTALAKVTKIPALAVAQTQRSTEDALKSRFGNRAELIIEQLENQDTDGAVSLISRSVLQMLVDILPVAEANVFASKGAKGIYQLNQTISSIREMLIDLQALRDKGLLGHRIVERTIRPSFADIGAQIVLGFVTLQTQAQTSMSNEDFRAYQQILNQVRQALAQYMEAQYRDVRDQVIASMS